MILTIFLGIVLIFVGMISAFLLKSISGILLGVCSALNGIVMIVTAIKSRPRKNIPNYNSEDIADYMLEIANDIEFNITYDDLGKMLFLAQAVWMGEIGTAIFNEHMFRIGDTPTTIRVDKLYGDEDVIKTQPIHRDIVWAYGYLLVNIVLDYQQIVNNKEAMDKINECISRIERDEIFLIGDFKKIYPEIQSLLARSSGQ